MTMETVQMKVSGLMCSFCTMSLEKALKRYPGVKSVMVNLVHGIVLVRTPNGQLRVSLRLSDQARHGDG